MLCALDDIGSSSLSALLQRFASYRAVHLARAGELRNEGFELLPSFGRPHFTVRLPSDHPDELGRLHDKIRYVEVLDRGDVKSIIATLAD